MSRFVVVGVNDERDFCECCGRTGLKRVVWIEDTETQEIKHFGTTCAAAPVKGFNLDKEIRNAITAYQDREQAIFRRMHRIYRTKGGTYASKGDGSFVANSVALRDECYQIAKQERAELDAQAAQRAAA